MRRIVVQSSFSYYVNPSLLDKGVSRVNLNVKNKETIVYN